MFTPCLPPRALPSVTDPPPGTAMWARGAPAASPSGRIEVASRVCSRTGTALQRQVRQAPPGAANAPAGQASGHDVWVGSHNVRHGIPGAVSTHTDGLWSRHDHQ